MLKLGLLLAPVGALAAAAAAAPAPAEPDGVWQGTIGSLPVRACFTRRDWGSFGAYYYMSRLQAIALEGEEGSGGFREGPGDDAKRPRWSLDKAAGSTLTGRWSGNGRTLPIRLTRVGGVQADDPPCTGLAFHGPRLAGVRTVSGRGTKDGVAFTTLKLDVRGRFDAGAETFQLDGGSAATRRINAELRAPLSGNPPEWFECISAALEYGPFEGSYQDVLEPAVLSRRWLGVVHHYDAFCGGAHPNGGVGYRTFDLASGEGVDLLDWLTDAAVKRERTEGDSTTLKTLRPAFRKVVLAGWKPDGEDCGPVVRDEEFWSVGLRRTGFLFTPELAHVVQACGEEFEVPFARLRPFLTEQGRRYVDALAAEPRPAARQVAP